MYEGFYHEDGEYHCQYCDWWVPDGMEYLAAKHDCDEIEYVSGDRRSDEDIDVFHENVNLRIERMREDSIWIGAYFKGLGQIHYWIRCGEDGLEITFERPEHLEEPPIEGEPHGLSESIEFIEGDEDGNYARVPVATDESIRETIRSNRKYTTVEPTPMDIRRQLNRPASLERIEKLLEETKEE